nr:sugar transporter SWEET1 isoform X3 [Vulpes vulpes]
MDVGAAPGCVRNLGQSGFGSREPGHLRERPETGRGRDLQLSGDDHRCQGSRLPSSPLLSSHLSPLLSGVHYSSDLRHMRMTRSVDNVQFLPFLTTDINNLSWLSYGALKGDGILIFVNATGAVLQTLYILVYVHYCPRKAKIIQTKSTQRLSFPLTIATLLTSASWTLYGFQLGDPYIMVPNLPGILTSLVRLWLFWKYSQGPDRNYQLLQT